MKETRILEFKSDKTKSYLKTVSAFANYDGGQIIFGVDDNGESVKTIDDTKKFCLDIENMINDAIHPQPEYELSVQEKDKTVTLTVKPGINKPYMYNSKAYKRNDTSTIEADPIELTRLILDGKHINYEELPSDTQDLTFKAFESKAIEEIGIKKLNSEILKTLNLYNPQKGYN
ncbi:MAG: ATP-binding protein, partial [Butyrivibrio sp.]|nr:ATP-binding protein [Butyrivibrio sp.]